MNEDIVIRRYRPETDELWAIALEKEAFGKRSYGAREWAESLRQVAPWTLVAELPRPCGEIVGLAVCSPQGRRVRLIGRIAVKESHRRQGVGRRLVDFAAHLCCRQCATDLVAIVREEDAGARAFFEAAGFGFVRLLPRWFYPGKTSGARYSMPVAHLSDVWAQTLPDRITAS